MAKTPNRDKIKGLTTMQTRLQLHWLLVGMQANLKTIWQFFKQLKILLLYDLAITILGFYHNELKICPYKNLYVDVYISFIHNCQNLEDVLQQMNT